MKFYLNVIFHNIVIFETEFNWLLLQFFLFNSHQILRIESNFIRMCKYLFYFQFFVIKDVLSSGFCFVLVNLYFTKISYYPHFVCMSVNVTSLKLEVRSPLDFLILILRWSNWIVKYTFLPVWVGDSKTLIEKKLLK